VCPPNRVLLAAIGFLIAPSAHGQAPATISPPAADSIVVQWARSHAVPLPSVDAPYNDSAFAFLRPLVGTARIFEVGEIVHGAHQPLALRNGIIRYAVTHLGFTGIAIESGFTESALVDRYVQGAPGKLDSVVHAGITWQFDSLPEEYDLIQWLRDHNAHAARKVHFYGLDLTGANDNGMMPWAARAVQATLTYAERLSPDPSAGIRTELEPMLDRFLPARYAEYSASDRAHLRAALDSLYRLLSRDSAVYVRASSPREYARGVRNAWMAIRMNDLMAMGGSTMDSMVRAGVVLRDSTMAENASWALQQEGPRGRLLVFAHDGHVMAVQTVLDSTSDTMLGYRLRHRYGTDLVILATMAGTTVGGSGSAGGWILGSEVVPADPMSFAGALARVGIPTFVLDVRAADRSRAVAAALSRSWPFFMAGFSVPIVPRRAFDAVAYLDRVTPTGRHP
jgi:erythromycin esterase